MQPPGPAIALGEKFEPTAITTSPLHFPCYIRVLLTDVNYCPSRREPQNFATSPQCLGNQSTHVLSRAFDFRRSFVVVDEITTGGVASLRSSIRSPYEPTAPSLSSLSLYSLFPNFKVKPSLSLSHCTAPPTPPPPAMTDCGAAPPSCLPVCAVPAMLPVRQPVPRRRRRRRWMGWRRAHY